MGGSSSFLGLGEDNSSSIVRWKNVVFQASLSRWVLGADKNLREKKKIIVSGRLAHINFERMTSFSFEKQDQR